MRKLESSSKVCVLILTLFFGVHCARSRTTAENDPDPRPSGGAPAPPLPRPSGDTPDVWGSSFRLYGLPKNPTNNRDLDVKVTSEEQASYSYAILAGSDSCSEGSFHDEIGFSVAIKVRLETDGFYKLCIKAVATSDGANLFATEALEKSNSAYFEYKWELDTTAPGQFDLINVKSLSHLPISQISWTTSEGANSYRVVTSKTASCSEGNIREYTTRTLSQTVTPLGDGVSYVCVWAMDAAGNMKASQSNPYRVEVDSVPPGEFSISSPLNVTSSSSPRIEWSESQDSILYTLQVATDSSCTNTLTYESTSAFDHQLGIVLSNDSTYYVCMEAQDAAGNKTLAENNGYAFEVDTDSLILDFVGKPTNPSRLTTLSVTVTSSNPSFTSYRYKVGDDSTDCSVIDDYQNEVTNLTLPITNSLAGFADGYLKLCAVGKDTAGNWTDLSSASMYRWKKDTVKPTLSFFLEPVCGPNSCGSAASVELKDGLSDDAGGSGLKSVLVSVRASTGLYLNASKLAFDSSAIINHSATRSNGVFSFQLPKSLLASGSSQLLSTYTLSVRASDFANNIQTVPDSMVWDAVSPTLSSFAIAGGQAQISRSITQGSLVADDTLSKVAEVCLKSDLSTLPTSSSISSQDACWVSLTSYSNLGISPAFAINSSNFPFKVGFIGPTSYRGSAWVKDQAGNISNLATDQILYSPGAIPELTDVIASGSSSPSNPPTEGERTILMNAPVYIQWVAGDPDKALLGNHISLQYTTDEINWITIAENVNPAAQSVLGECTLPTRPLVQSRNEVAGCYVWRDRNINGYLRVRVAVKDADDQVTFSTAPAINLPNVRFLLGNTEVGIGASARATIFQNTLSTSSVADSHSLVVTHQGDFIFRDFDRGLFRISQSTGILETLIRKGSGPINDTSPTPLATSVLRSPLSIAKDFSDRILVLESDRLRRIDLTTMTIETLAGGGTDDSEDNYSDPTALKISAVYARGLRILYAVPPRPGFGVGEKIVFSSENTDLQNPRQRIRILDLQSNTITSKNISGTFTFSSDPSKVLDVTNCQAWNQVYGFDPNSTSSTEGFNAAIVSVYGVNNPGQLPECQIVNRSYSVRLLAVDAVTGVVDASSSFGNQFSPWGEPVVGMNGIIYYVDRHMSAISQYSAATRSFTRLIGTGVPGRCEDGVAPLACAIDPQDVFVNVDGTLYFMDRGRVRTVQGNQVVTVMGQSYAYGDGQNALSARFGDVNRFGVYAQNGKTKIVVLDAQEQAFREAVVGGSIQKIAGNGLGEDPVLGPQGPPADQQGIQTDLGSWYYDDFALDSSGTVYFRTNTHLMKLDRSLNRWISLAGGGQSSWTTASDGTLGNALLLTGSGVLPRILGFYTSMFGNELKSNILVGHSVYNFDFSQDEANRDTFMMDFDTTTGALRRRAGKLGASSNSSAEFEATPSGCILGQSALGCSLVSTRPSVYSAASFIDQPDGKAMVFSHGYGSKDLYSVRADNKLELYDSVNQSIMSFAIKQAVSPALDTIYYCSSNGTLYKTTRGSSVETALNIGPSAQVKCDGRQLTIENSKLFYIYKLNKLNGLAEMSIP